MKRRKKGGKKFFKTTQVKRKATKWLMPNPTNGNNSNIQYTKIPLVPALLTVVYQSLFMEK